jgi:hypothetical protein
MRISIAFFKDPPEMTRSSYSLRLHIAHLYVTLDLRPLRGHRGPSSQDQSKEQKLPHDFTSLSVEYPEDLPGPALPSVSFTSDSTSFAASSTAARTGSLSSIIMSS